MAARFAEHRLLAAVFTDCHDIPRSNVANTARHATTGGWMGQDGVTPVAPHHAL
jgi:hypothetical protein